MPRAVPLGRTLRVVAFPLFGGIPRQTSPHITPMCSRYGIDPEAVRWKRINRAGAGISVFGDIDIGELSLPDIATVFAPGT